MRCAERPLAAVLGLALACGRAPDGAAVAWIEVAGGPVEVLVRVAGGLVPDRTFELRPPDDAPERVAGGTTPTARGLSEARPATAGSSTSDADRAGCGARHGSKVDPAADPGRRAVAVAHGEVARAYPVTRPADIVWPRSAALAAGVTARFRVEPLRRVEVRSTAAFLRLRFVADRTVVPAGPAARVDALQAWIDVETPRVVTAHGDSVGFVLLPPTAWWVVGDAGGAPVRMRLGPDEGAIDVAPTPLRRIEAAPTVAGRPVPRGTLVAPGRLDLAAAAALRTLVELGDTRSAVLRGSGAWTPADLPADEHLTLWHPEFGLAYARWDAGGPRDAEPEIGAVGFVADGGRTFSGTVALWPAWPGTGDVFSRPSDRGLRCTASSVRRLVFRGLPPGRYRFDHSIAPGSGSDAGPLRPGEIAIPRRSPRAVVTLTTGPPDD